MRRAHFARTLVLAAGLFFSLVPAGAARAQDARFDGVVLDAVTDGSPVDADSLLHLWAKKLDVPLVADPQLSGTKIRFPGPMSWAAFRKVLDFHDIVIDQQDVPGATLFFAHLRRNLPCKAGPPFPVVPAEEAVRHPDEIVTSFIRIENGDGNDIFATVRGLLVRDVNRIGNILYVRGPDTLILVDFGSNVDYYARVIKALDVPAATTRVFHLEHANVDDAALVLDAVSGSGTKVVSAPRSNQLIVRGSAVDVARLGALLATLDVPAESAHPRFRADVAGVALWKIATALAAVAFIGQTILLRRFQRSARLTKLSG